MDVNAGKVEATIVCRKEIESTLRNMLPNGNFISIDLDEYINKDRRMWIEDENGECYFEERSL